MPSFQAHCLLLLLLQKKTEEEEEEERSTQTGGFRCEIDTPGVGSLWRVFVFCLCIWQVGTWPPVSVRLLAASLARRSLTSLTAEQPGRTKLLGRKNNNKPFARGGWGSAPDNVCVCGCVCPVSACLSSRNVPPPQSNNCKNTGKSVKVGAVFPSSCFTTEQQQQALPLLLPPPPSFSPSLLLFLLPSSLLLPSM